VSFVRVQGSMKMWIIPAHKCPEVTRVEVDPSLEAFCPPAHYCVHCTITTMYNFCTRTVFTSIFGSCGSINVLHRFKTVKMFYSFVYTYPAGHSNEDNVIICKHFVL
jgi:hypothetical protein